MKADRTFNVEEFWKKYPKTKGLLPNQAYRGLVQMNELNKLPTPTENDLASYLINHRICTELTDKNFAMIQADIEIALRDTAPENFERYPDVKIVLETILDNRAFLNKVTMINDGSYRAGRILVSKVAGNYCTIEMAEINGDAENVESVRFDVSSGSQKEIKKRAKDILKKMIALSDTIYLQISDRDFRDSVTHWRKHLP